MHQAREVDILYGFDQKKEKHFLWFLNTMISTEKDKSYTSDAQNQMLALGRKSAASEILALVTHKVGWYCLSCGNLDPEEVTYDERCSICNNLL